MCKDCNGFVDCQPHNCTKGHKGLRSVAQLLGREAKSESPQRPRSPREESPSSRRERSTELVA